MNSSNAPKAEPPPPSLDPPTPLPERPLKAELFLSFVPGSSGEDLRVRVTNVGQGPARSYDLQLTSQGTVGRLKPGAELAAGATTDGGLLVRAVGDNSGTLEVSWENEDLSVGSESVFLPW